MNRHRALAAALVASGSLVAGVSSVASASSADPLGCRIDVFDPGDTLDGRVETAVAQTGQALDADVRVRAERSVDGGLDARIDQLVAQCDGWSAPDGELADDMVVVLFSEVEREASVYYGADLGPDLESRWSDAVDVMTAEFPDDYSDGVVAALRTLRTESPGSSSGTTSSGDSGVPGTLIVVVLMGFVALLSYGVRRSRAWSGGSGGFMDDGDDTGRSSRWSSSGSRRRRRSSFGGFSSRSGSSRSSRSRRSSSRGSRRAGGGTKKW